MRLKVTVNGIPYSIDVEVEEPERPSLGSIVIGSGPASSLSVPATANVRGSSQNAIVAPLAGSVARVLVEAGQEIKAGQVLLVLEAMKMETEISAPADGKVAEVLVEKGEAVQGGQPLIALE